MKEQFSELVLKLAEKLTDDLQIWLEGILPSAAALSTKYGVSRLTMLRVLRKLRDDGKLDFHHGSAIRVTSGLHNQKRVIDRTRMSERICDLIEGEIASGRRGYGHALPKYGYFTEECKVSPRCVRQALQLLSNRNLIHMRGREWVVGPRPAGFGVTIPKKKSSPAILILQSDEDHWLRLRSRRSTGQFALRFEQESAAFDMELSPVMLHQGRRGFVAGILPSGLEEIEQYIARLGTNYRGTLVSIDSTQNNQELHTCIERLLAIGKRVVLFDAKSLSTRVPLPCHPLYAQCIVNREQEINNALELLCGSCMHKNIGILKMGSGEGTPSFVDDLARIASAHREKPNIFVESIDLDFWQRTHEKPAEIFGRLCKTGVPHVRFALNSFIQHHSGYYPRIENISASDKYSRCLPQVLESIAIGTPALSALMRNPDITAIISCGTASSRCAYFWFRSAGISIPRDISLLSFGRIVGLPHPQISTIDSGIETLAFSAFHFLAGHSKCSRNANGDIVARSSIGHHHSVAFPRNGSIRLDLSGDVR